MDFLFRLSSGWMQKRLAPLLRAEACRRRRTPHEFTNDAIERRTFSKRDQSRSNSMLADLVNSQGRLALQLYLGALLTKVQQALTLPVSNQAGGRNYFELFLRDSFSEESGRLLRRRPVHPSQVLRSKQLPTPPSQW